MLKFKCKNGELEPISNFLSELKLKARASRGRSKIIKMFAEKSKEFNDDFNELRKEFFEVDENGKFKEKDNRLILKFSKTKKELDEAIKELSNDEVVINFSEYEQKIRALYEVLEDYEYDFEGQDALIYDKVMDELDKNFKEEK